ncbi:MAG: hypothetical protein Q7K57_12130 [Burkholderiaceae bacterium]|nr:hypothetical protein [Burkholderiaceae bacterium]
MKLVAGALNNVTLDALHAEHTPMANEILVAVPYSDNSFVPFLELAVANKIKLTFYGRYDTSLLVALPVIIWFLENNWRKTAQCIFCCFAESDRALYERALNESAF